MHSLIWIATRGVMEILGLDPYQSETQYLERFLRAIAKRKYGGNLFPLLFPLQNCTSSMEAIVTMPGKPYQSKLIPYEKEIKILRRRRPPMPYVRIADHLRQKHGLIIQPPAIYKFLKVRSRGRKVFSFGQNIRTQESPIVQQTSQPAGADPGSSPKPKFNFPFSERYNLHRLPQEEAEARRKKLEAEGH